ncbi:hypothetical protein BN2497_4063 [Janthinobacterium sp. CG23_2]|nr:hypothetical protein BN2497_4063 [Janthinobacterium sp. CG23_2]CUU28429.1 hypothetical protein BN3177_4063 [Janthinobacterium sp. CG23_2]
MHADVRSRYCRDHDASLRAVNDENGSIRGQADEFLLYRAV